MTNVSSEDSDLSPYLLPGEDNTTVTIHDGHLEDSIQWSSVKTLLAEPKLLQNMSPRAYANGNI